MTDGGERQNDFTSGALRAHEVFFSRPPDEPLVVPAPVPPGRGAPLGGPSAPIVVPRSSPAWIATGAAIAIGAVVAVMLHLDRVAAHELVAQKEQSLALLRADIAAADDKAQAIEKQQRSALAAQIEAEQEERARAGALAAKLRSALAVPLSRAEIALSTRDGAPSIVIADRAWLDAGLEPTKAGRALLARISTALAALGDGVQVEVVGHSDAEPVGVRLDKAKNVQDPWLSSLLRARTGVKLLEAKLPGQRLTAIGRGSAEPSAQGRGKLRHRRVEIVVRASGR